MTTPKTAPALDPAVAAPPSPDEIAAAQAVFARMQAAQNAKRQAAVPKIAKLLDLDGFEKLLDASTALRADLAPGEPFYDHLNAMVIGMSNLKADVAALESPSQLAIEAQPAA